MEAPATAGESTGVVELPLGEEGTRAYGWECYEPSPPPGKGPDDAARVDRDGVNPLPPAGGRGRPSQPLIDCGCATTNQRVIGSSIQAGHGARSGAFRWVQAGGLACVARRGPRSPRTADPRVRAWTHVPRAAAIPTRCPKRGTTTWRHSNSSDRRRRLGGSARVSCAGRTRRRGRQAVRPRPAEICA